MNQSDLARALGLSRKTVNHHVKSGIFVPDENGEFDLDDCKKRMREMTHPRAKAQVDDTGGKVDYHKARTFREIAEAKIAELKFKEMDGSLIKIEVVEKILFEKGRQFRDGIFSTIRKIAPAIAGETDIDVIEHALYDEFRALLDEFDKNIE